MFDRQLVVRQLRYSGMMETIRIRRAGYPIRHMYGDFVDRYRLLVDAMLPSHKLSASECSAAAARICAVAFGSNNSTAATQSGETVVVDYQLGRTKLFLKDAQDVYIEHMREQVLANKILVLQRSIRGWAQRRKFVRAKHSALLIQSAWRGYVARRRYALMRRGFMRLQATYRARLLTRRYVALRALVMSLQRRARAHLSKQNCARKMSAIVTIQAGVRRFIALRRYRRLRLEAARRREAERLRLEEQQRLESQLGAKRAKQEAERSYNERLLALDEEMRAAERRDQDELRRKRDILHMQMQDGGSGNGEPNGRQDAQQGGAKRAPAGGASAEANLVDEMFAPTGNNTQTTHNGRTTDNATSLSASSSLPQSHSG